MTESLKTPSLQILLRERRGEILRLAAKHGASNVRVFGSVARGEAHATSDVDFLVAFNRQASIWDVVGLWQDLGELLQREVSLVTEATLEGEFKENVLKDAIPL